MSKVTYYTKEGLKKLNKELKHLKTEGRKNIAKQLEEARSKGDLSENAEYDAAKDAQGILEMKISKLESALVHARVLSNNNITTCKVSILNKVKVLNFKVDKNFTYTIVAEEEADLSKGKISINSPIGKGLLGKKKNEEAIIKTPVGEIKLKILHIYP